MPTTAPILLLTSTGDMKSGKLTIKSETTGCQLSDIQTYLKKKKAPTQIGTYAWKSENLVRQPAAIIVLEEVIAQMPIINSTL